MPEIIICPHCQRKLRLPEEFLGKRVQCPSCKSQFPADQYAAPARIARKRDEPVQSNWGPRDKSWEECPDFRSRKPRRQRRGPALALWLAVAGGIGLPALFFVLLAWQPWAPRKLPEPKRAAVPENDEQRRKEIREALRQQKPLAAAEIAQELRPFFESLNGAFRAGDQERIMAHFDMDRLYDELGALEIFFQPLRQNRQESIRGMRQGMGRAMQQQAPLLVWTGTDIKNIKMLEGNEAVVIARHRVEAGMFLKMRWWVTKRTGTWRLYDMEDLDVGLRISTTAVTIVEVGLGNVPELARAMNQLRDAIQAVALRRDPNAAEKILGQIAAVKFPKRLDGVRSLVIGLVRLQRGQAKEALAAFEQAHRLHPDMPCLDLTKAIAFNDLGDWNNALKHLEAYQGLLGDDAAVCRELGEALRGLSRFPEARAAYRKALDYDPKDPDAFLGLLRALAPEDNRDDLGQRFAKLDRPHENFDICAEDCRKAQDFASLEPLALAMRKIDPNYAPVDFFLALAKAWAGRADQAVPLFQAALAKQPDAGRRQVYVQGFLQAMAHAGPLEAYRAVPDARAAFRVLAPELQKNFQPDELRQLVAAHAKNHADDPWLPFFQAEVLVQEGNYPLAEKAFAAALAKPPDAFPLDQFRGSRVLARYHTGQGLSAYADIGPKHETFQQLVNLCFLEQNYTLLQTLLAEHAKIDPNHPDLARYRIRLKIRQDKTAEGITLFQAALAREAREENRKNMVSDFLFDMMDAGKALEGYQAVPDATHALQVLAEDLLDRGNWQEFRRLLEAHRQKLPDDPWLHFYCGELHIQEKAWDKAAGVLAQAWKKAPADLRNRFRWNCVFALYKAGRAQQAYDEIEPRKEIFGQLANLLAQDKKGGEIEALIKSHRPHAGDDPDLLLFEARAKIFLGQPIHAIPLFHKAYQKQTLDSRRKDYLRDFVLDMAAAGQTVQAYGAAPDKVFAFEALAGNLVFQKKEKELAQLLDAHRLNQRADQPWHHFFSGELALLRGDIPQADRHFSAAFAKASPQNNWTCRHRLYLIRIKAGKAAATYQEFGRGNRIFQDLAQQCLNDKNAPQLADLIAAHRLDRPEDSHIPAWELDVKWLNQDYAGTWQLLTQNRQRLAGHSSFRWKFDNYLVRCLVKLKKTTEAIQEAETIVHKRQGNRLLLVLAQASAGDVNRTIAVMDKHRSQYLVEDCYRDPDLGPLLRGEPFREFRLRFPEPKKEGPE